MGNSAQTGRVFDTLYNTIKKEIIDGTYQSGQRLPTEIWMCRHYGVSRPTLRKVISELVEEDYLQRLSNRGIYVTYNRFKAPFERTKSLFQEMQRSGYNPHSKILSYKITAASIRLSKIFNCAENETVVEIVRLRYAKNIPAIVQTMFLLERYYPDFNPWELRNQSFHKIMEDSYKLKIYKTRQTVEAKVSNRHLSSALCIEPYTPLLYTTSTTYLKDDIVIEYQYNYINTNVIPYTYIVTNN